MLIRPLIRAAALAAVAATLVPASAPAATVSAGNGTVTVRDTAGVDNRITVEPWFHDSDGVLVTEGGPTLLTAGGGCILWDEDILHPRGDKVFCPAQPRVLVEAGGGNDIVSTSLEFYAATVLGGAGADLLTVRSGDGELQGGKGNDTLVGVEGNQLMAGGPGIDTADYANQSSDPVDISLDGLANDGIRDFEFDNVLPSIENVRGSLGGGTLVGSAAANRLKGGAGNDDIDGGAGADVLLGRAGADVLRSADRRRDARVDCGTGIDTAFADRRDPVTKPKRAGATCESVFYLR